MPIYDLSYRAYRGTFSAHTWRWLTIAKAGLQHYLSRKLMLVFLFIGLIHPIGRGVLIWISHQISGPNASFTAINDTFFRGLLLGQGLPLLMICIWPGGLLIAKDIKTNAIQLYLSKPLTRMDYVVGKLAVVAGIGSILLLFPALLLFLMEVGMSTSTTFITTYYWLPLAAIGYSAVIILGAGMLVLAVSSMTRSGAYAGLLFFALIFFSQAGSQLLLLLTGNYSFSVLSITSLAEELAAMFFGGGLEFGTHPYSTIIMYLILVGLSALILRRRVRAVEIVT